MTPTIGRIVHYVRPGSADGVHPSAHAPAIITAVHEAVSAVSDDTGEVVENTPLSLTVFNPEGFYLNNYCIEDQTASIGGSWHWPERDDA